MRDYGVARGLFSFLEILFWIGVVVGIIIAFGAASAANRGFGGGLEIVAAMPGIMIGIISLFGVALIQNGRAAVDSAEYGQQMLKVARDQLEVSKQSLKQGTALQNSFADLVRKEPATNETATPEAGASNASYAQTAAPKPEKPTLPEQPETPVVLGKTLSYRDQSAELIDGKWHLNGIAFESREKVVEYIETYGVKASSEPLLKAER